MKRITIEEEELSQTLRWLMPWKEKTDGVQLIGLWEDRLSVTMMLKLVELWLSEPNRKFLRRILKFYHPVDQAALCYALMIYLLTGQKMTFRDKGCARHFLVITEAVKSDMHDLFFANHLKYMLRRYGRNTNGSHSK